MPNTKQTKYVSASASTSSNKTTKQYPQGRYWLLTIPQPHFTPFQPRDICWIKGQLEVGAGGFTHWQIICCYKTKVRLSKVKETFGAQTHAELSRSEAANDYVHKDETSVVGTRFELGDRPIKRNDATDWERVHKLAREGKISEIDPQIQIQHYRNLQQIRLDNTKALPGQRETVVYWGPTGTGKSHRAWSEASFDAYPKQPTTKWWDGYQPDFHKNVVIDEFDGQVGITHLLRWCDKYPCLVETKGSGQPLAYKKLWITSNIHPLHWYPDGKKSQIDALMRRIVVVELNTPYKKPIPVEPSVRFHPYIPLKRDSIPVWDNTTYCPVPEWRDMGIGCSETPQQILDRKNRDYDKSIATLGLAYDLDNNLVKRKSE